MMKNSKQQTTHGKRTVIESQYAAAPQLKAQEKRLQ